MNRTKRPTRPATIHPRAWKAVWWTCQRKRVFATLADAEAFGAGQHLLAYLCPFRGDDGMAHWHLTSAVPERAGR